MTEHPPKEINAATSGVVILSDTAHSLRSFDPLVTSINPAKKLVTTEEFTPKEAKRFPIEGMIFKSKQRLITILKIAIYPPTISTERIAEVKASDKILSVEDGSVDSGDGVYFFRNKNPFMMAPR